MKKKITLRRISHREQWRYAIIFEYDIKLGALVKSITGATWSNTNKCWYANADESALKQILTVFRDHADIDISAIVSGEKKEDLLLQSPEKTSEKDEPDTLVSFSEILSSSAPDLKEPLKVSGKCRFDPVQFTINESDGRLAVKFTGRYDPEWIEELKLYGRAYYVKIRNEWLLPWSQLTVDSLSDYFSQLGIEVIVKKYDVPEVLKELRSEMGNEVRERFLGEAALNGIEMVRRYLSEKRYSKNTLDSYLSLLELFFKYYHDRDPKKLTRKDISGFFHDYVLKLGYSASYQNQMISAIKTYYGLCGMNRVGPDTFERPRRSRSLPKVFSKEEVN